MPEFGKKSLKILNTCHLDLQDILHEAIKHVDFSVIDGYRNKKTQDKYYAQEKSKLRYPYSKHNNKPSLAVDIVPYPDLDWKDVHRFRSIVYFIKGIAIMKNIILRLGIDWNGNYINDETFSDLPHIELVSKKIITEQWVDYVE